MVQLLTSPSSHTNTSMATIIQNIGFSFRWAVVSLPAGAPSPAGHDQRGSLLLSPMAISFFTPASFGCCVLRPMPSDILRGGPVLCDGV
jgi:hypothetical protein